MSTMGAARSLRLSHTLVMGGNCIADRSPRACVSTAADIAPRAAKGSCHDAALECVLCGHPRFGRDQTGRAGLSGRCAHGGCRPGLWFSFLAFGLGPHLLADT